MPDKRGRLTPQERCFSKEFADSGNAVLAATKAGYAHPSKAAYNALARPAVQGEVRRQQLARLENEALPLAVGLLVHVLQDEKEATRNRLTAAQIVIKANETLKEGAAETPLQEKSAAELRAMLDVVETRLAELAVDVTPGALEHESAQDAPNIFD